jgi:hypothetical protein
MIKSNSFIICLLFVGVGAAYAQQTTDQTNDSLIHDYIHGFPPYGALVLEVIKDSQADKCGFKRGDIIISYNGIDTPTRDILIAEIKKQTINRDTDIPVVIMRDGKCLVINVAPGELGVRVFNPHGMVVPRRLGEWLCLVLMSITVPIAGFLVWRKSKQISPVIICASVLIYLVGNEIARASYSGQEYTLAGNIPRFNETLKTISFVLAYIGCIGAIVGTMGVILSNLRKTMKSSVAVQGNPTSPAKPGDQSKPLLPPSA